MKNSRELLQDLDRYAAAFTVAALVFASEQIDLVWGNDAHRPNKLDSLMARGARLLGSVGVKINPEYLVLAESDRASTEGFVIGVGKVIRIEAIRSITGCETEISETGEEN